MRYLKLTLAYDGTNYHGWQVQIREHGPTVQGVLEERLRQLTGERIRVTAAGRTDAGVHARGQVVNLGTGSSIPVPKWPLALNSVLPPEIRVLTATEVSAGFHARYDAKGKTYRYTIDRAPVPDVFRRHYAYHLPRLLQVETMQQAACLFIGTHDFRSFCASGSAVTNFTRTLYACDVIPEGSLLYIKMAATGFLYQMVRIIVGTLLKVGRGRLSPEAIPAIIAARDRRTAGPTVPPQGLRLEEVYY